MEERALGVEQDAKETADPKVLAKAVIRGDFAKFRLSMRPSRVHRFGVFAEEPIPAGEKVIEYTDERVSRAERINRCCEPNCRFHKEDGRVWVVSLLPIGAGEELLLDYKFRKSCQIVPCYCGAARCRGTINVR